MKKAISSIGITLLISISISAFAKDITNSSNELTPDNSTSADNLISFENLNADGAQQQLSPPSISPSTSEVIELTGIPSPLIGIEEEEAARFSSSESNISQFTFDPSYTPICTELNLETKYTLSGTATGNSLCYYFAVTDNPVRIDAFLDGQAVGNNHNITVAQDDPSNPYTFPTYFSSSAAGNANERVSFISDAGHYYLLIDAALSDGSPLSFIFRSIPDFDDYEVNDGLSLATELTYAESVVGNIDSVLDSDFYTYTAVGTKLVFDISQNTNFHELYVSLYDGGPWLQVTGSGRYTHTATPGDEIKFLVLSTGVLNSSNPYTITVYDDRGLKIGQMVGHIVNSQTLTGQNYLNQTITGYYVDGYPIKGGVVGNFVRFFGQLKLQNGEPARMMQFIFDYTAAEDGIGSVYHENIVRADHDGFFDILVPLPECKGYFTHIEEVSGLDPDLLFTFDRERYHVRADTINGEKVLSTANEYFFNLCQVRTIPDDDNPVMRILNPFTYE